MIDLRAGDRLILDVYRLGLSGTLDSFLTLYGPGTIFSASYDSSPTDSGSSSFRDGFVDVTITSTGTYYAATLDGGAGADTLTAAPATTCSGSAPSRGGDRMPSSPATVRVPATIGVRGLRRGRRADRGGWREQVQDQLSGPAETLTIIGAVDPSDYAFA